MSEEWAPFEEGSNPPEGRYDVEYELSGEVQQGRAKWSNGRWWEETGKEFSGKVTRYRRPFTGGQAAPYGL
jgi:hypothetical protein